MRKRKVRKGRKAASGSETSGRELSKEERDSNPRPLEVGSARKPESQPENPGAKEGEEEVKNPRSSRVSGEVGRQRP